MPATHRVPRRLEVVGADRLIVPGMQSLFMDVFRKSLHQTSTAKFVGKDEERRGRPRVGRIAQRSAGLRVEVLGEARLHDELAGLERNLVGERVFPAGSASGTTTRYRHPPPHQTSN